MRRRNQGLIVPLILLGWGCSPDGPPRPPGAGEPVVAPSTAVAPAAVEAAPVTKSLQTPFQRRKEAARIARLPKPTPPPPRPEGEPKSPEDLARLSEKAAAGEAVDKPGAPPIERIDETRLRVGRVLVDRKARRLEVPAKLNMTEGILEYLAVASQGKLHESVFELEVEPSHMHLGLILLGVAQIKYDYGDYKGPPKVVEPGGRLSLKVRWKDPKTRKTHTHIAEDWLFNRGLKGSPEALEWVFLGSTFWNNRYGADMDRSTITLIADQVAVIGTTADSGNPYRGDSLGFEVFTKRVPPKGTPVTLLIEVLGDGRTPPK